MTIEEAYKIQPDDSFLLKGIEWKVVDIFHSDDEHLISAVREGDIYEVFSPEDISSS